jgi:hydrogenase maturation protein HypF
MARRSVNSPLTSSAGRLFDAVAAILGVRDVINYEGQAAIELEQLADPAERGTYRAAVTVPPAERPAEADLAERSAYRAAVTVPGDSQRAADQGGERALPLRIDGADLVRGVVEDLATGTGTGVIAARFHNGVTDLITDCCLLLRERYGISTVALSGGVFQNLLLLTATVSRLREHAFSVLVHSRVPCNDGGISLGQAVAADAMLAQPGSPS